MKPLWLAIMLLPAILIAPVVQGRGGPPVKGEHYGSKEPDVEPPVASEDWKRMGRPKPGEWLHVFREPGQTFAEYRQQVRKPRTGRRNRIYVVPLGEIAEKHPELLRRSVEFFGIFFGREVVKLDPQRLGRRCYNARRGQYDAGAVLDRVLAPLVREHDDALALMGLACEDLYHGDLNFVFGLGSHGQRVGLYSVYRFHRWIPEGQDADKVALRRTLKTSVHEIGHILGMAHCTFYHCVMNGSNSLDESDRRPLFLCPVCLRKLEWHLGLDRLERYRDLKDLFTKCGLKDETAFCQRRIKELEAIARAEEEKQKDDDEQ